MVAESDAPGGLAAEAPVAGASQSAPVEKLPFAPNQV